MKGGFSFNQNFMLITAAKDSCTLTFLLYYKVYFVPEDVRVSSQVPSICGEMEQRDIETLKQSKVCSFSAPGSVCGDEEYV